MCTSVLYRGEDTCFGRTLDLEYAYADRVVLLPAHAPLHFLYQPTLTSHHALLGTAVLHDCAPLWYDALNDQGLAMAGLNFPKSAVYAPPAEGKRNCASFELIPLVLGQCATIPEAHHLLSQVNITPDSVSPAYPPRRCTLCWQTASAIPSLQSRPQTGCICMPTRAPS